MTATRKRVYFNPRKGIFTTLEEREGNYLKPHWIMVEHIYTEWRKSQINQYYKAFVDPTEKFWTVKTTDQSTVKSKIPIPKGYLEKALEIHMYNRLTQ